jgi:2-polyprenyl-6-methoxyphenol hydroxylase-like FAD-dependent oxidoreductase
MSKNIIKNRRILISGASIAGPALAYWLHKYGFEVTIVECAPSSRPGGYGVDLRGAAVKVVEKMGVLDIIRAHDTNMQGVYFVDAEGKVEGQMSGAAMANHQGVDIEIMREDLATILYDLAKDKATYLWGDSIVALNETENGVTVQFEHAKPQTFDIVIGADGMHSGVRGLVFGDGSQFSTPLGCYISIFTLKNYLNVDHRELFYNVPGKTVGMYSARNNTEAKGMFLFRSAPLHYGFHDTDAQKKLVTEAFAGQTGWETRRLLKYMNASHDFYFDAISQIHMPAWSRGRVALVGDAAYGPSPLSGQGSGLAIVGAYILAGELKAANGDYATAFAIYEEQMRPFAEKNQKIGKMVANSMVEDSKSRIWLRNVTLRIPGLMSGMFKMITKSVSKAANAIDLKLY